MTAQRAPRRNLFIALALLAALLLAAAWFAGPWLTLRGLQSAMDRGDYAAIEQYVDFPTLRNNLRPQIEDRIARDVGARFGPGMATQAANAIATKAVDGMVSVAGIGILLQGDALLKQVKGDTVGDGLVKQSRKPRPFDGARLGYESVTRFNAIVDTSAGEVTFVLQPRGWRWKVVDIRLPKQ